VLFLLTFQWVYNKISTKQVYKMKLLSEEKILRIHTQSLDMLEKIGININSEKARRLFLEHGCEVKDCRVYIPGKLMEELLAFKQDDLIVHSRAGKAINVAKDGPFMHNCGYCAQIINIRDGSCRDSLKQDAADLVRLEDALPNLDIVVMPVYPNDMPDELSIIYAAKTTFENTDKPYTGAGIRNLAEGEAQYRMYCVLAGGEEELRKKPMFEMAACPISPMTIPEDDCEMVMFAAEKGVPVSANSCPTAGLTAPVTLLGSLTQQNAENLAVAALARLIDHQTKIIYAARLVPANMLTANIYGGSPDAAVMSACACQLARHYGFISNVYGLGGTAAISDIQLGLEKSIQTIYPMLAGAQVLSGFGSSADGYAMSYEMMAIDNEIFGHIKHLFGAIDDDSEDMGFEALKNVMNGSSFIIEENTVKYMRSPEIWNYKKTLSAKADYSSWVNTGKKTILDYAEERVREILKNHTPAPLPDDQKKELDNIYRHWEMEVL